MGTAHPVLFEQAGDFAERRLLGSGDDARRHQLAHLPAVGLGEFAGESRRRRHGLEPPGTVPVGPISSRRTRSASLITPTTLPSPSTTGKSTHIALGQETDRLGDIVIVPHGHHVADHHVHRFHVVLSNT
jgi:hypothetical protein